MATAPRFLGLALHPTAHDLYLSNNALATVTNNQAIGEHVKQRLMFYRGEWFLDTSVGTPWFQDVFVRPHNPVVIDAVIKREILTTPGILELTEFDLRIDERKRHIEVLEATATSTLDAEEIGIFVAPIVPLPPVEPPVEPPPVEPPGGFDRLDFSDDDFSDTIPLVI